MRRQAFVAVAALLAAVFAVSGASATTCTTDHVSATDPHLVDPAGDYEGLVGGSGSALIPYGDVYGDATDLTAAWVGRPGGVVTANIQTVSWQRLETNAVYYFLFTYEGADPSRSRRFVSAQLIRPLPNPLFAFRHGYLDNSGPVGSFVDLGSTTGTMTPGSPGAISIVIPLNKMQIPTAGVTLGLVAAEARVNIGAAGGGLLGIADDTEAAPCEDVTIPPAA